MLTNPQIKLFRSLHTKKGRREHKKFIIEGHRIIDEAFRSNQKFYSLWCTEAYTRKNVEFLDLLKKANIKISLASEQSLSKICKSQNNQGIIAIFNLPINSKFIINESPVLIIDNISDPGNMGTILRTAEWFGIKNIILSRNCVDPYNSKVIRAAMGSHFHINQLVESDLQNIILELKNHNFSIIGAGFNGTLLNKFSLPKKWGLVLGSEAAGISKEITLLLDQIVTIGKPGNIESLNVAVAAGIILNNFS